MSSIDSNTPPIIPSLHLPQQNFDPKASAKEISKVSDLMLSSSLLEATQFDKSKYTLPTSPSSFTLTAPGTENKSLPSPSENGLSNSLGAILFFLVSMLEELQKEIGTKMTMASANLAIGQKDMELSSANAEYQAGMAAADATAQEARMSMISGIASICFGALSIGACCMGGASEAVEGGDEASAAATSITEDAATGGEELIEMTNLSSSATTPVSSGVEASEDGVEGVEEAGDQANESESSTSESSNVSSSTSPTSATEANESQAVTETEKTAQTTTDKLTKLKNALVQAVKRAGPKELANAITMAGNGAVSIVNSTIQDGVLKADKELQAVQQRIAGTEKAFANLFSSVRSQFQDQIQSSDKLKESGIQALETYFANLSQSLRG